MNACGPRFYPTCVDRMPADIVEGVRFSAVAVNGNNAFRRQAQNVEVWLPPRDSNPDMLIQS